MHVALYARVSTADKDQNPETQLRPLREHLLHLQGATDVASPRREHTAPGESRRALSGRGLH